MKIKKKIKKQDAYPHLAYKSTHPTKGDTFPFYCCYYRCIFQSTHPTQGDTTIHNTYCRWQPHFNPLIPCREIQSLILMIQIIKKHFNPLIPCREIQQYCTKICYHILTVLPKNICFLYLLPQKFSKFQELTAKTIPIPVRILHTFYVSFQFAP